MEFITKLMGWFQSDYVTIIGGFLYLTVEYWLGKTEMVKAGSTAEVILSGLKKVLEFLKIKKPSE